MILLGSFVPGSEAGSGIRMRFQERSHDTKIEAWGPIRPEPRSSSAFKVYPTMYNFTSPTKVIEVTCATLAPLHPLQKKPVMITR